jgi:hypothetical protein
MRIPRLTTQGARPERKTRDTLSRVLAVISILLALVNAYYTFVEKSFQLTMVHPESALQATREAGPIELSIAGANLTPSSYDVAFINSGNQPTVVTYFSYLLDLEPENLASQCQPKIPHLLVAEDFKPVIVKGSDSVAINNRFATKLSFPEWSRISTADHDASICVSAQIAEGGGGFQKVLIPLGTVKIPHNQFEIFSQPAPGVKMQTPIIMSAQNGMYPLISHRVLFWFSANDADIKKMFSFGTY